MKKLLIPLICIFLVGCSGFNYVSDDCDCDRFYKCIVGLDYNICSFKYKNNDFYENWLRCSKIIGINIDCPTMEVLMSLNIEEIILLELTECNFPVFNNKTMVDFDLKEVYMEVCLG